MALTNEQNKELEEIFKTKLKEQYDRGISVGILTMGKVVSDKLNDSSVPLAKRIEDIKKLCKVSSNLEKKFNEIADRIKKPETTDEEQSNDSESENPQDSEPLETTND